MSLLRVRCVGGPEGDFYHEAHGTLSPDRMGLPDSDGVLRWYDVKDGVAYYSENQEEDGR